MRRTDFLICLVCIVFFTLFAYAEESPSYQFIDLSHWRVRPMTDQEYAEKRLDPKSGFNFYWTGKIGKGYKYPVIYNHEGAFIYRMQFFASPPPKEATPILIINNIASDSVIELNGKKLKRINTKRNTSDVYKTEYWYEIPIELIKTHIKKTPKGIVLPNNYIIIWVSKINKKNTVGNPISKIVFENPDEIAERERKRKLRYPYLYDVDATDDPYVARHW